MKNFTLLIVGLCLSLSFKINGQVCPVSSGTELIPWGDFESVAIGTDFTSDYTQQTGAMGTQGEFNVGTNPQTQNTGWWMSTPDHTSGSGNMYYADGGNNTSECVLSTTLTVTPNTNYFLSAWIRELHNLYNDPFSSTPAKLVFTINGTVIGDTLTNDTTTVEWRQFFEVWYSGASTTAVFCIKNANTANFGNDFALDDISFSTSCENIVGGVNIQSNLDDTVSLCQLGGSALLDPGIGTTDMTFEWYQEGNPTPVGTSSIYTASAPGKYYVCLDTLGYGCPVTDSIEVVNTMILDMGPDVTLCDPPSATITTGYDHSNGFLFRWFRNDTLYTSDTTASSIMINSPGQYRVDVNGPGSCDASDSVTITSDAPIPSNTYFCGPSENVNLSISNTSATCPFIWYDAPTGGSRLGTGCSFTTPSIGSTTTYYVEDSSSFSATVGATGPSGLSGGGSRSGSDNTMTMEFDTYTDITLDSLTIAYYSYSCTGTTDIVININQGGTLIGTVTVPVPCSGSNPDLYTIPVGISIPAGTGYTLDADGSDRQLNWYNNGGSYPYSLAGVIDITGDRATYASNSYPGYFNWVISTGSDCGRTPVMAIYDCLLPIEFISFEGESAVTGSNLKWSITPNEILSHFIVQRSLDGIDFTNIATIDQVQGKTSFEFLDANPKNLINYYRIVGVETTGDSYNSSILKLNNSESINFTLYPNPSSGNFWLSSLPVGDLDVKIFDRTGRLVYNEVAFSKGTEINLQPDLSKGLYLIEIVFEGHHLERTRLIME